MKFAKVENEGRIEQQASMLSAKSDIKVNAKDTVYIDMDKLMPNSKNEYKMSDIEKLSGMIKLAGGIWQNLIVKPADEEGRYIITTGERRWRAACLLKERGEYPQELENKVPCTVKGMDEINLPLSENLKEEFAILVTNQYRRKTDGELLMEMQKWRDIIKELRNSGVESLPSGIDEESEMKIKGTPTRTLVAEQLGISTGQVSRLEKVEKQGSDKLLTMLMEDKMDLAAAEKIIKLEKPEQTKVLEQLKSDELEAAKTEVHAIVDERAVKVNIGKREVENAFEEIVSGMNDEMELTQERYKKYQKALEQIRKILSE